MYRRDKPSSASSTPAHALAPESPGRPVSIEARGVRCILGGVVALGGVSLHVDEGACVALVGESGAGKTTLLRCFNRMVVPSAGEVRVGGIEVSRPPVVELRRRIGYVPQQGGLLPHWRVLRNVALTPRLLGHSDGIEAARRALESVGLPPNEFGERFPGELSGGQRQRVALARAIAHTRQPAPCLATNPAPPPPVH